jgi:IclR family mhp operon transcriptional activator
MNMPLPAPRPSASASGAVRAVSRSLAILQSINRHGVASMSIIARDVGLPYATAHRLVQTLVHEGLIELEPCRKRYRPTDLVETLSCGARGATHLVSVARAHLVELTREVSWPVSLVTRVGQSMMVRDSTHALTSLTFNLYHPGYTLPMLDCASGLVYLAHTDAVERESIVAGLKEFGTSEKLRSQLPQLDQVLVRCRNAGYATKERNPHTDNPGLTSSISVPISTDGGKVHGVLTLIFFASALDMRIAVERYLAPVTKTARAIAVDLDAGRH